MARRPIYDFDVEGPVQAEVFVLWLDGASIKPALKNQVLRSGVP